MQAFLTRRDALARGRGRERNLDDTRRARRRSSDDVEVHARGRGELRGYALVQSSSNVSRVSSPHVSFTSRDDGTDRAERMRRS